MANENATICGDRRHRTVFPFAPPRAAVATTDASKRNDATALSALAALSVLVLWVSTSFAQAPDDGYRVFRPDGPGPHPAVAFVSGCSGFSPVGARKFYERVAEKLRGQGYVVLFVDYVGRRGLQHCARPPMVTEGDAAKDLVTAVTWLRSQEFVDKARISALGWAYGGGAVLVALADYTEEQLGLDRAIVYYPVCRAVRPWRVATPVLMLLAGDDEVARSRACQEAVKQSANPDVVKTMTYHGALPAFDVAENTGRDPRARRPDGLQRSSRSRCMGRGPALPPVG